MPTSFQRIYWRRPYPHFKTRALNFLAALERGISTLLDHRDKEYESLSDEKPAFINYFMVLPTSPSLWNPRPMCKRSHSSLTKPGHMGTFVR